MALAALSLTVADVSAQAVATTGTSDPPHLLWTDPDGIDSGLDRVPLEHARWFASLVVQLTPEQVHRAFEAAGASPAEVDGFATRFVQKITELQAAVR